MTYASRESSVYSGKPYELFWFAMGATNWRMTAGDVQRTYLTQLYTPESITRTEISQNQELNSGGITIKIPRTHPLALLFIGSAPPAPISCIIYRAHDGEAESETVVNFTGRVATATFTDQCALSVVPDQDALKRTIPLQVYQSQCNWILYGDGCGISKTGHAHTGVVTAMNTAGDQITVAAFGALADDLLKAGWIEKGDYRKMITDQTAGVLTLLSPMPGLAVGDTITAYDGCQLDAATCKNKFNNLVNFSGFDKIPSLNPFNGIG